MVSFVDPPRVYLLPRFTTSALVAVSLVAFGCLSPAHASTLVLYPFNNSSDGQSGFSYSTFDSAVLTSSTVSKGSGLGTFSVGTDSWSDTTQVLNTGPGSDISAATAADAITNNWYFTISLTPNTTMNINSIEADWSRGGTSGVRGWFVRSSQDSFATDLYSNETPADTATGLTNVSFDLSGFTGVGATDFRFYIYTPDTGRYMDFQNIQFNSTAVPEPSAVPEIDPNSLGSVLALVLGSLGLLERRRLKAA